MATVSAEPVLHLDPACNGMLMTPDEFDAVDPDDVEEGWRYELINGVLIVSAPPLRKERDPNEELGYMLRYYKEHHPQGSSLDATVPEEEVRTGSNRRRVDRAVWAGLGRLPGKHEVPTVIGEFVSRGKANRKRDYETKRAEYKKAGVKQYWIFDHFQRTMTVIIFGKRDEVRVLKENDVYRTSLLPGFELPLARLFALADRWPE